MPSYSLSHVPDHVLLRDLAAVVARDRAITADLLAHLGEVDARKLYLPAAYPSMFAYCVGELRLSEDAAAKRLRAARTARRCPGVLAALADGRLHLGAIVLLAPHLTPETEAELLAAATHKSKSEIEQLLAERFPCLDVPATVDAIATRPSEPARSLPAPGPVKDWPVAQLDRGQPHPRVTPLSPQSFALQCTVSETTHEKLRHAQALLGHQVPSGDLATVLDRALDALIARLEKRKLAVTTRPRSRHRSSTPGTRHVPAHVRRAVWERDGGRCTFVSATGRRCEARARLEFDHIEEFACGGESTVAGMRLRCRAHNQYQAEQSFGADFMREQRAAAQAAARARAAAAEVIPWLRQLGFRADEAQRAAKRCEDMPDAPLEERVRAALSTFRGRS